MDQRPTSIPIKTILVDDEPKNLRILKQLLQTYCSHLNLVGEAQNIQEAKELIVAHSPDLVFLDIEMPHGNAFDLLEQIMPVPFEIIFITAFDAYALKAFRYSALDYLLKPVSIEDLVASVQKATDRMQQKTANLKLENLLRNTKLAPDQQRIAVPTREGGMLFLELNEVSHIMAESGYSFIFDQKGQKFISDHPIKFYEDLLPASQFFRVHYSYIINRDSVKKYKPGRGGSLELKSNVSIEVATRRKGEFLEWLESGK